MHPDTLKKANEIAQRIRDLEAKYTESLEIEAELLKWENHNEGSMLFHLVGNFPNNVRKSVSVSKGVFLTALKGNRDFLDFQVSQLKTEFNSL